MIIYDILQKIDIKLTAYIIGTIYFMVNSKFQI